MVLTICLFQWRFAIALAWRTYSVRRVGDVQPIALRIARGVL
jgi:hypothetical protein